MTDSHSPAVHKTYGLNRRRTGWNFLVVLALIAFSSIAGRQIYSLFPPFAIWALIATGSLAAVVFLAFLYKGPLPRWLLVAFVLAGAAVFVLAVFAGAMMPPEIAHVVLFGALGAVISPLAPRIALPVLAAVSGGDELLQALLPWRVGSLIDVALNAVSAIGGYTLVRLHEQVPAGRAGKP